MGSVLTKLGSEDAWAAGVGGATGAFLSTVTFYPIELITTRIQASMEGEDEHAYKGIAQALTTIYSNEGVAGLFVGAGPVIVRSLAFDFTMPWFYVQFSQSYTDMFSRPPGVFVGLVLRTLAGQCNALINSPIETVTNRLMASHDAGNIVTICRVIMSEGGILNFWAGIWASMILAINPALTYTLFDWLKKMFTSRYPAAPDEPQLKLPAHVLLLLGMAAKAATLLMVYPLMRAKVLMQTRAGSSLLGTLHDVAISEGYIGLYKGMGAKFSKSLGSTALLLTTKDLVERWLTKQPKVATPIRPAYQGQR